MSAVTMFEVRVEVPKGKKRYGYHPIRRGSRIVKGAMIQETIIKMLHIERRTHEQAKKEGEKHGKVISVQKLQVERIVGNPENMRLDQASVYDMGNPYPNAVSMDEMVWRKRNIRRKNMKKDKQTP